MRATAWLSTKISPFSGGAAAVNEGADEGDVEQLRLISTPGTMWNLVSTAKGRGSVEDIHQLAELFPDEASTKYSLKWWKEGGPDKEETDENRKQVQSLLASVENAGMTDHSKAGLEKNGVFYCGPVGDNILHLCYLLNKYDLARYLIRVFGASLINYPYQKRADEDDEPGIYEGEVVLHIAIVNKELPEVRYLLNKGADVNARAWGNFFAMDAKCYYGEYPLSFAVCMQQPKIVEALIKHHAPVDAQDSYGNTALHMTVLKSLPEMYILLADTHNADESIINGDGFSPLALAAKENNTIMFDSIIRYQRTMVWKYGPVTCYHIPLEDIDTVQTFSTEYKRLTVPALKVIAEEGNAEMIELNFITSVLSMKWKRFGRTIFYAQMALYSVLMICLSFLVVFLRNAEDGASSIVTRADTGDWFKNLQDAVEVEPRGTESDMDHTSDSTILVLECVCFGLVVVFALLEFYDAFRWVQGFRSQCNWTRSVRAKLDNILDTPLAKITPPPDVNKNGIRAGSTRRKRPKKEESRPLLVSGSRFDTISRKATLGLNWGFFKQAMKEMAGLNALAWILWTFILLMIMHFWVWMRRRSDPTWEPWPEYTVNSELSLAVLAGWLHVLYFTSGFKSTGPIVVMMLQMIYRDVAKFMTIYLFVALAFAQATYLLIEDEVIVEETGQYACNFCSVPDALLSLFRFTLGDINYVAFQHKSASRLLTYIFIAWALISNILMMNLLIALMNSTYTSVMEEGEKIWNRTWARIVLLMERRLPPSWREGYRLGDLKTGRHGKKQHMYDFIDAQDVGEVEMDVSHRRASEQHQQLNRIEDLLTKYLDGEEQVVPVERLQKEQEEMGPAQAAMATSAVAQTKGLWKGAQKAILTKERSAGRQKTASLWPTGASRMQ